MQTLLKALMHFLGWALVGVPGPRETAVNLPTPYATIAHPLIKESSGFAASDKVPGRFWTLNDSGNGPWLFAMDAQGRAQGEPVKVRGVRNMDWEAIASDGKGHLWIGDFGNNQNRRKDLAIYQISEPGEMLPAEVSINKRIRFRFPDQQAFSLEKLNFDCEAMFVMAGRIYLLTKHRADSDTKLYRLENLDGGEVQTATLLDRFAGIGQVTDAALSLDGQRLAVLTYSGIWIFDKPADSDLFLQGSGQRWLFNNWALGQCESVAWTDAETLLIGNEQRDLFQVPTGSGGWVRF